jgi:hypothetical protein
MQIPMERLDFRRARSLELQDFEPLEGRRRMRVFDTEAIRSGKHELNEEKENES